MAVAELQLQVGALHRGTIAHAGDQKHFGEAIGHAGDEIADQRALHAPEGAGPLGVRRGEDRDLGSFDGVADVIHQRHGQFTLGPFDHKNAVIDGGGDAGRNGNCFFTDARHGQNTWQRISPPTFFSRASASERTP